MSPENIIKKFEERLGNEDFIRPSQLVSIGLFGSTAAVRNALRDGILPFIKVSSHRTLIPRECVLEHLRKSCSQQG
jgi:hypothetical protein